MNLISRTSRPDQTPELVSTRSCVSQRPSKLVHLTFHFVPVTAVNFWTPSLYYQGPIWKARTKLNNPKSERWKTFSSKFSLDRILIRNNWFSFVVCPCGTRGGWLSPGKLARTVTRLGKEKILDKTIEIGLLSLTSWEKRTISYSFIVVWYPKRIPEVFGAPSSHYLLRLVRKCANCDVNHKANYRG